METPVVRGPSAGRRVRDRIRFGFERLILRGLGYRLLFAAAIVVVVALVAGSLVMLLDPGSTEPGEAVWWAFLRLTDPGYLGDDEGTARRSISTVVTVLGYVLFLGLLIAILTQWLNETIKKLESGVTPVAVSDHVLLLGWTRRTPTIVQELLRTGARVERFLALHGARGLRIVILAERVDDALVRELRERLGDVWNDRQVLLRSGTPLRVDHLERVGFRDAAVLILPGAEYAESNPEAVDAETVKTLMSVSTHAIHSGSTPPLAVAELYDSRKAAVARRAYEGACEFVAADDIISRLVAQSVLQRGLCDVFTELLTLDEGCAFYVRKLEEKVGAKVRDLRGAFPRAIFLGTVRAGERRPTLNPDPDAVLEEKDELVFIARRFEDCVPQEIRGAVELPAVEPAPPPARERRRVLVLGWSRKVPALLRELGRYGSDAFEIDVVSRTPVEEREEALDRHVSGDVSASVRHIEAAFSIPGVLEGLEPQRYDNVLILASERYAEQGQADATSVSAYLSVRALLPEKGPRPAIFVELLDEQNEFLFARYHEDVIVSPMIVSYVLSQVSLRRELAAVIEELSRARGPQIVLHAAREYLSKNGPVRFEDLDRAAAERGEIALGLRLGDGRLALNPDRDAEWTLTPRDEVVVLASYGEPGA